MKFHQKSLLFEINRKTHQKTFFCLFQWLNPEEARSSFPLKNSKNMNHNYDVINLYFNETRQKVFAHHHSELGEKNLVLSKYSVYFDESPEFFYFGCHRTLSEGQEIASKPKFSARPHSGSVNRKSSIFWWNHSMLSYWEVFHFYFVYQLISHVIEPKTIFSSYFHIYKRENGK